MNASSETKCRLPILGIQQPAPWFSPAAIIETHFPAFDICTRLPSAFSEIYIKFNSIFYKAKREVRRLHKDPTGIHDPRHSLPCDRPAACPGAGSLQGGKKIMGADVIHPEKFIRTPKRMLRAQKFTSSGSARNLAGQMVAHECMWEL